MKKWDRGGLGVSANGRYLTEGGRPFFWLGDTAWLMFHKLSEADIGTYLRNRAEKGFNVIQATLIHMMPGNVNMGRYGRSPLEPEYWRLVDRALDMAEELGLYVALLPIWGNFVKNGTLNMENVDTYAKFLADRFRGRPNIIWVIGGDVRGDTAPELFCREARLLKSYDPGRLMTYHPFGRTSSSLWFQGEDWLDLNLFQSGHRRYDQQFLGEWDDNRSRETFFGEDNWRYVDRDHGYDIMKPTIDGEPSYEGIVQGLHDLREPYWEEWDVRRYAYWSVFQGAAGHTYGNNAIMQFYEDLGQPGDYGVRESWRDALHYPGSGQLRYLRELMESVDFTTGMPREDMLVYGQKERYHRISVFAGEDFIFCYDYSGDSFMLDLSGYRDKTMDAWWMDPRNGTRSYIGSVTGADKWLASPLRRRGSSSDWVLVMREAK